jgi:ribosomal peptide maturation radical SAM protein 1
MRIFYEVKANLKRNHIEMLREAGITRIQPGIESLSDHVLKLMRKGTTGLRNIQFLKWAKEMNVTAEWNLLYGFPGETSEDYDRILQMLPALRFLNLPCAVGPIRLDRFSPHFDSAEEFGLVNLRPMPTYNFLYPFEKESLMRIAYYFEFDYADGTAASAKAQKVIEYMDEWKRNPEAGCPMMFKNDDETMTLLDTRSDARIGELKLGRFERAVYEYCDEVRSAKNVLKFLRDTFPEETFSEIHIRQFLDSMTENRLMITDGENNYLALAINASPLANASAKFENELSYETPKPLSSFLPKELPVFKIDQTRHTPIFKE